MQNKEEEVVLRRQSYPNHHKRCKLCFQETLEQVPQTKIKTNTTLCKTNQVRTESQEVTVPANSEGPQAALAVLQRGDITTTKARGAACDTWKMVQVSK